MYNPNKLFLESGWIGLLNDSSNTVEGWHSKVTLEMSVVPRINQDTSASGRFRGTRIRLRIANKIGCGKVYVPLPRRVKEHARFRFFAVASFIAAVKTDIDIVKR